MEKINNVNKNQLVKIYFAHPKDTYDTEYELLCIERIKKLYPLKEIVNPKDIEIPDNEKNPRGYAEFMVQMQKYYFPAIDCCDLLIAAKTRNGKISGGVRKEIEHATRKGIPIEYLDVPFPEDNRQIITDDEIDDYYGFPMTQLIKLQEGECYNCHHNTNDCCNHLDVPKIRFSIDDYSHLNEQAMKLDNVDDNYKIIGHDNGYRLFCPTCIAI